MRLGGALQHIGSTNQLMSSAVLVGSGCVSRLMQIGCLSSSKAREMNPLCLHDS